MSTNVSLKRLGARLRAWRLARGLSLAAVAAQLGVSYQQIQKYEKAQAAISLQRLFALAAILRVDVIVLLGDQGGSARGAVHSTAPSISFPVVSDEACRMGLLFDSIESVVVRRALMALVQSVAAGSDDVC